MSGFSVSSAMIGCVVGAWFAGTLADRIGRVRVMQLAAALFVFSALFTGLASNIWVFVIFRIVGGLGVGFTSAIGPAYISEISPSSRRGFLTGFQQMAIALGIVASLVVNDSYLLGSGGARDVLGRTRDLALDADGPQPSRASSCSRSPSRCPNPRVIW